jgi:putative MATE family efflux protein
MRPLRRSAYDREIARLAVPAFGALVAEPLYVLADTAVVGHIGTSQLGGLAVAASILLTGYMMFVFLAFGTTAAVARLLGAGDEREAAHQAVQSMWLALGISIVLVALGAFFGRSLIGLYGPDPAVADEAWIYLRLSLPGVPSLLVVLAGTGYLRGLQDTRTPLLVALVSALANLVLEVVLVFGFGLGIGASAVATVLAQTGAAAVYVVAVVRAVRALDVGVRPHLRSIVSLLRVARDLLVRTAALRAAFTLATAVATRIGTVEVAAHQIAFEIWNFLALCLDAIAIAGQAIVGRALGAGRGEEARAAGRRMIELGVVAGVVLGALVVAVRPVLAGVFSTDADVVALAAFLLWWVALVQPLGGVVFVLDGLLIGAGDTAFLAVAMVVALVAFGAAAGAVLVLDLGIGWLWGALLVLLATRASMLLARFRSGRWVVLGAEVRRAGRRRAAASS